VSSPTGQEPAPPPSFEKSNTRLLTQIQRVLEVNQLHIVLLAAITSLAVCALGVEGREVTLLVSFVVALLLMG
jgi:hypothetical protein